ncbi:hypothetical protein [Mesorhizobium sp. LjNodule214]|uniref:hypothetical protein n=1 Tax=Mesorhizobium sp. LjNodule214 TaxID=3342252 RepID=UPI003ECF16FD
MSGKPAIFPALDPLPSQAQKHVPPAAFDIDTALAALAAAAPNHPDGPGDHFAPHATVDLPDAGVAGIEHASLPVHISDWWQL